MTIEYRLSTEDLIRFYRRAAARSPFYREIRNRSRWQSVVLVCVLGGVAAALLRRWELLIFVAGAAVWTYLLYPDRFLRRYLRNMDRHLALEGRACLGQVHRLEVVPAGLHSTCTSCDTTVSWSQVQEIEELADDTMVFTQGGSGFILPRSSLVAGDYDAFRHALRNKGV
jgi:hypothetical protein